MIIFKKKGLKEEQTVPLAPQRKEVYMDQDQILNSSPVPPKLVDDAIKTYNFFDALKMVAEGKRITKLEWGDKNTYGILTDGELKIMLPKGLDGWLISDGDLTGTDWIILD